jgi:hypothetical protein
MASCNSASTLMCSKTYSKVYDKAGMRVLFSFAIPSEMPNIKLQRSLYFVYSIEIYITICDTANLTSHRISESKKCGIMDSLISL